MKNQSSIIFLQNSLILWSNDNTAASINKHKELENVLKLEYEKVEKDNIVQFIEQSCS